MTIVGVVGDVRQYGPAQDARPELYMPYQQHVYNGATLFLVIRTQGDPAALSATVSRTARERSPDVSVRATTMNALMAGHIATPRFRAWLLSLFAVVALCLAMAGVYGVMAYVAAQRSKEIALRMALGASPAAMTRGIVGRALRMTAAGLTLGVLGAAGFTRLFQGMLFAVDVGDATTYASVIAALGGLSLLAAYVPARRCTRIDPIRVLHAE